MTSTGENTQPESGSSEGDGTKALWEKPVLLPLDVDSSEGAFSDFVDEDDFKSPS